ncbi:LOW QUALITY PROTEIN: uncharacterized protein LOC122566896 [Bombus pyrosoma]|uniref:LOW QUALITY PROTEIN: uncharacterized protein LOC122566896 n=1 Tax=Bombus pyrosoma TaxID=396416 RepID=UPI001CB98CE1|nr:LOW QUALITY PROTEIN: uncharacterized protein LOC122566896 [Bombus pyrosoma]
MEREVIKALQKGEYTLNKVNSYGENLLHISAANGCIDITKEIFRKHDCCHIIDRKNKFGWTPLMLAIRNRNIKMAKFLLQRNANVNESTDLGMSVFGLAAAINKDMFETIYEACPSALLNSLHDDVTPLCIAAMKNDKNLFFRLIELGFNVSKSNDYTYCMMKQSIVPEIKNLAKYFDTEDYWNDNLDNILIENEPDNKDCLSLSELVNKNNSNKFALNVHKMPIVTFDTTMSNNVNCSNNVIKDANVLLKPCALSLETNHSESVQSSLISPTLTCNLNELLPTSPNIYFTQNKHNEEINLNIKDETKDKQLFVNEDEDEVMLTCLKGRKNVSELPLQRLQSIWPQDLNIQHKEDLDTTLEYVPEFSPLRQQNIPPNMNDENVFGENTPTPPRYRTPPRGVILNSEEAKMFVLLKHYGLGQYVSIFLEQEVDIDLFMTLTNEDLIEIGIKNEADRKAILEVINRS